MSYQPANSPSGGPAPVPAEDEDVFNVKAAIQDTTAAVDPNTTPHPLAKKQDTLPPPRKVTTSQMKRTNPDGTVEMIDLIDGLPEPPTKVSRVIAEQSGAAAAGSSCHQCKSRRSALDLIYCTHVVDKKNKSCRKKYCEHCLKKFYKEEASEISDRTRWDCPSCRKICCCAACRRRVQKDRLQQTFGQGQGLEGGNMMVGGTPTPYVGVQGQQMDALQASQYTNGMYFGSGCHNSSFAMLYAVAQMPAVRKLIKTILDRKDMSDGDKVENIATLLRRAVAGEDPQQVEQETIKNENKAEDVQEQQENQDENREVEEEQENKE